MAKEAGCNCVSEGEHNALVFRVNISLRMDVERAKMRQERNTQALRAAVLSQINGHNDPQ